MPKYSLRILGLIIQIMIPNIPGQDGFRSTAHSAPGITAGMVGSTSLVGIMPAGDVGATAWLMW